jgi:hypothetical protein
MLIIQNKSFVNLVFGFFSKYDQFQIRFYNLAESAIYSFLNSLPVKNDNESFLKNVLFRTETNVFFKFFISFKIFLVL